MNMKDTIGSDVEHGGGGGMIAVDNSSSHNNLSNTTIELAPAQSERETMMVNRSKIAVYLFLILAAAGAAYATYRFMENEEAAFYRDEFEEFTEEVFETTSSRVLIAEKSLEGLADLYTSLATASATRAASSSSKSTGHGNSSELEAEEEEEEEFYVFPNFLVASQTLLETTPITATYLCPLITQEQRQDFEQFAIQNQGWIQRDVDLMNERDSEEEAHRRHRGLHEEDFPQQHQVLAPSIPKQIHNLDGTIAAYNNNQSDYYYYVPVSQMAPPPTNGTVTTDFPPILLDLLSVDWFPPLLEQMLQSRSVILSQVIDSNHIHDDEDFIDDKDQHHVSAVLQPVYSTLDDGPDSPEIIGVVVGMLEWELVLDDILESEAVGMIIDIENTCDDSPRLSFEIMPSSMPKFLGENYQHDTSLQYMSERQELFAVDTDGSSDDRRRSRRRLQDDGDNLSSSDSDSSDDMDTCRFFISTHATTTYVDNWQRSDAVIYVLVVISIFVFTGLVFLTYDLLVQKVLSTAEKSKTTVAVLEDVVKDRTKELEKTNQQLAQANQSVRAASALQLQHFACMSHEIRTPLNCIIGCASLMQDSDLDPLQKDSLDMIVTSGNLLLTVVNDVLDYSKLESGNVDIDISRTNLQEMLDAVVWSMQTKARNRDITIDTNYDVSLPQVIQTDIRRVQQVLYNLLGNAVKFSGDNGTVELRVTVGPKTVSQSAYSPPVTEGLQVQHSHQHDQQQMIRFAVKDYGVGIARDKFAKIFHPFLQESTDTETLYGGSGLGLAISSKLVHRLGGTISVDSELGQWTEFSVELPLEGASTSVDLSLVKEQARICLVNKDPLVQQRMNHVFEHFEIEHQIATSLPMVHPNNETKTPVFIVQEDLWNPIDVQLPSNAVVITTGMHYLIKHNHGHIRSLVQMVPNNIISFIAAGIHASRPSSDKLLELSEKDGEHDDEVVDLESLAILVAEDNRINQKVLVRILNRLGIQDVTVASNGKEAVDFVKSGKEYHVCLMDMQMPVMDGLEACTIIRNCSLVKRPKVVFVTAHALGSYEKECYKAGATDFLSKPCNIDSVKQVLLRTMKKKKLASS